MVSFLFVLIVVCLSLIKLKDPTLNLTYLSTDGLKDYYSDLLGDCQKVNSLAVLNPELINNPAVYSLLTSKYHKAEELGIKMNFEVFLDLESLFANGISRSLAIMGGEPLCEQNIFLTLLVVKTVKEKYPDIKIYIWSGYTYDYLLNHMTNSHLE